MQKIRKNNAPILRLWILNEKMEGQVNWAKFIEHFPKGVSQKQKENKVGMKFKLSLLWDSFELYSECI